MPIATIEKLDPPKPEVRTLADLLHDLGDIPLQRVWMRPRPGDATEQDVLFAEAHLDRLCELVDGTLVEKAMGSNESLLASYLASLLWTFITPRKLGIVLAAGGMLRLFGGQVRMPDLSFVSKTRFPDGLPKNPIWDIAPSLAVEVLSLSNTPAEMIRKRQEYFSNGVSLVWMIDPTTRAVTAYTDASTFVVREKDDLLEGGTVLPGFTVPVSDIFAILDV